MKCHICNKKNPKHINICIKCRTPLDDYYNHEPENILLRQDYCYYRKRPYYSLQGTAILTNTRLIFLKEEFNVWALFPSLISAPMNIIFKSEDKFRKLLVDVSLQNIKNVEYVDLWFKKRLLIIHTKEYKKFVFAISRSKIWVDSLQYLISSC